MGSDPVGARGERPQVESAILPWQAVPGACTEPGNRMVVEQAGQVAGAGEGYRRDIDGLRGVAVLAVVLYHLDPGLLPGGYTGVDVFFVISGFLITRIIAAGQAAGTFSFRDFYLRRVRRILPVLLVVVAATLLTGALVLLPADLESLARSAAWSLAAAANLHFWLQPDGGYFADASAEQPLLHLWSLGVEEQFYLLWPALLVFLLARGGRGAAAWASLALVVASFAWAEAINDTDPRAAFYLLPARAGELLLGALLALRGRSLASPARVGWAAEGRALAGLAALAWSFWRLDHDHAFPGLWALVPTAGAVLLIHAGGAGSRLVAAVLGGRALVAVGLVSYSIYLWHWPVLAYIRYFSGDVGLVAGAVSVGVIALLSVASYRWVERPARRWRPAPRAQLGWLYLFPAGAIALLALALVQTQGLKDAIEGAPRFQEGLARIDAEARPALAFDINCQLSAHDPARLDDPRCLVGGGTEAGILLAGDSNAAQLVGLFEVLSARTGLPVRNLSHSVCPPLFQGSYSFPPYKAGCDAFRPFLAEVLASGRFHTVVLGASWRHYAREPSFRADLEATLDALGSAGLRVFLVGSIPHHPGFNRHCERRGLRLGWVDCSGRLQGPDEGEPEWNRWLAEAASRRSGVHYLSTHALLCAQGVCRPVVAGELAYFDAGHLSMDGSRALGRELLGREELADWLEVFGADRSRAP